MSVEKSLEKFRKNLESGSVYEAQQLIKTVYHRLRSRKLIEESLELLEKAACLQLDHEQVTCATELASTLIQAYRDDNLAAEETAVQRILRVLIRFEACSTSSPQEYTAVAKAALKWLHNSASSSTADAAVAEIHARLGRYMFREQGLEKLGVASAHLARSRDMQSLADVVSQAARDLAPGEPELLAVRAVLQVLNLPNCLPDEQLPLAEQLGSRLKGNGTLPKDSILAHFVNLLFEALQRKSLNLVRLLRREYEGSLKQDPELLPELDAVEAKYCGAKPPGNGLEGLLGNMLSSLGVG